MHDVRDLIAAWVTLWNSYDLDQVQELFLTDDRLTYFSSERQGAITGFAAIVHHHQGFGFVPGGKPTANRLWLEGELYQAFGDAAVVTAIWFFRRAATGQVQKGPVTFVCVRDASGGWRLAHLNFGNYPG